MALKKCKECGNDVSTKASSCPKCGAVLKKKIGCLGYLGIAFLFFLGLGLVGVLLDGEKTKTSSTSPSVSTKPKVKKTSYYKEGETVHVGYTSYAVWRSWWSRRLSKNRYLNQPPNAMYLFVDLTVRNDDKKARTVPPFKLIDENGAEYEASAQGWAVKGSIGIIETLNPSVSKRGFVIFDVPNKHKYRMKLSGGFWSSKDAYVQLKPK